MSSVRSAARRANFPIADEVVRAGQVKKFELPIARLMSGTPVALPVIVHHGAFDGPTVWLSAALHGDEICGVEIIRRVLSGVNAKTLRGTIISVPVVNVHGFNTGDRYLPDRRDLNRSFPGSARGSLASRVAHLMMTEIISRCDVGIDLHTGSDHRINLPQIRGDLARPAILDLARTFGAPLSLHAKTRDGSLRGEATEMGADVLLFEGGEAARFDEYSIQIGTAGVQRVLAARGLIDDVPRSDVVTRVATSSSWTRATRSGIAHLEVGLGDIVEVNDVLATIHDPFGKRLSTVRTRQDGMVIGHTQRPLVNRGDAIVHIARLEDS